MTCVSQQGVVTFFRHTRSVNHLTVAYPQENFFPHLPTPNGLVLFLDGSKPGTGVYEFKPRVKFSFSLGRLAIAFQSKVFAVLAYTH